jgi:RHS repeat-associated protein
MAFAQWFSRRISAGTLRTGKSRSFRPALQRLEDRLVPAVNLKLVVPPSSSYGVNNSLLIQYTNTGTTPAPAPVVALSADNANLWLPTDPAISGPSLQLLATAPSGPAGTLAPGAGGSIVVDFTSTSGTAANVNFSLGQLSPGQAINWASLQSSMQPSTISATAWNPIFANFTANVGSTTDSYQAALDADATYLAQLGQPTNDVAQLVVYEINKASDAASSPPLGDSVDAALPTPGPELSFARWFQGGIAGRNQFGTLGLGWTDNWAVTASADSSSNVTINAGGSHRYFSLQSDGTYLGTWGDDGTLTALSGGGYQLKERDGSLTTFNADATLNYVQDTNGNRITATYSGGLLTRLTATNGAYLALSYTGGLLTEVSDSTGRSTTYSYDAASQHLLSSTDEFGTTTYSYVTGQGAASENALASITYADHTHDYFGYDSEGRLIDAHQDNNQQDVTIAYNPAGGFTTTDALGHKTTVLTDDNGQVCETMDALGNVTHYTYDLSGDLTGVKGPQGANFTYTYNLSGDLTSATDPLGLTTQFSYDARGNLTGFTDARGNTTHYAYDGANDLLSVTAADGTQSTASYNPLGEATQLVNANGKAVNATYNAQGLVTQEQFADGSSYTYSYDSRGNLLTAAGPGGTITFQYQDAGHPDLVTEVDYPNGQYLKFSYNGVGQRTRSVDQSGFTVNYQYDALGRLQGLTDGSGNLIVRYTYDAAGNLTQKDMGNGTRTVYGFDTAGDVLSITNYAANHTTVNSFDQYTYDALGNVLTDTNQDGQWAYSYDADGQLLHAVFTPNGSNPDGLPSQDIHYAYDAAGNRTSQTVNGVTTTYVVNNVNEYTSSTTGGVTTTYQYDKDGNLTSQASGTGTTTYSYDLLGELTGVNGPGLTASYGYDALGNRNGQTVNGTTTLFLIDPSGLGDVASTYSGSGSLTAHYTYGLGLTSQVDAAGHGTYYDFNLTGNTVGITGAAGNYVNKYSYQPFGQTTTITAGLTNPFTFAGQFGVMQDGPSLFNMRAREYSPGTGQFLATDPLGVNGGDANTRRYVGNGPVTAVDPGGTQEVNASPQDQDYYPPGSTAQFKDGTSVTGLPDQHGLKVTTKDGKAVFIPKYGKKKVGNHTIQDIPVDTYVNGGYPKESGSINPADNLPNGITLTGKVSAGNKVFLNGGVTHYNSVTEPEHGYTNLPLTPPEVDKIPSSSQGKKSSFNPVNPIILALANAFNTFLTPPAEAATTENSQPSTAAPRPMEGAPCTLFVTGLDTVSPITSVSSTPITNLNNPSDSVPTNDRTYHWDLGYITPFGHYVYSLYATFTPPEEGDYGAQTVTVTTADGQVQNLTYLMPFAGGDVYDAPIYANPVNFTVTPGGQYHGVVATFTDSGPNEGQSGYNADVLSPNGDFSLLKAPRIQPGPGNTYFVYADLAFSPYIYGSTGVNVHIGDNNEHGFPPGPVAYVGDRVTVTAPGQPQVSTSVSAQLLQANSRKAADPPLAIIDTTDPSITSASQVSVSVAAPSDPNTPVPLVTGTTLTQLPGGVTRIEVDGVVSTVQPGAGPVTAAPLNITLGNEPPLTAQVEVDETAGEYTVNPVSVLATQGQPVQNVQVALLAGPVDGSYSATIDWGDGETSPGQITALGGDLFSVTSSKPHPYAAPGTAAITVTVSGPGDIPAPPAQATGTILAPAAPPTSSVAALPAATNSASFAVSWSGSDGNGPGIACYTVYVSDNGGAYTAWQQNTTATSATFTGQDGHSYRFYSVATDNLGQVQPTPAGAQATTLVDLDPPTSSVNPLPASSPASFPVSWSGQDGPGGSGVATFDVLVSDNGGPFTAWLTATTQTAATFGGTAGHTYGFYSVATDNAGNRQATPTAAQATTHVGEAVVVTVPDSTATEGSAGPATVATFTDTDSTAPASAFSATIAWGDGHTSAGTVSGGNGSFTVSGVTLYTQEGRYPLGVTVTDAAGNSFTGSGLAHVARVGPPPSNLGAAANALTHGAEYYTRVITAAYQNYLGRAPDAPGLAAWVSAMEQGYSDERLEAGFIGSAEFIQQNGGLGAGWITALYRKLLGRDPDQAGLQAWLNALAQGMDPSAIAYGFAASAEREAQRISADYQTYLGRLPESQDIINQWVSAFVSGTSNEDVIAGFVGSPEYFQKHYDNAPDWVYQAYQAILGRDPDAAGLQNWLAFLGNG